MIINHFVIHSSNFVLQDILMEVGCLKDSNTTFSLYRMTAIFDRMAVILDIWVIILNWCQNRNYHCRVFIHASMAAISDLWVKRKS